MPDGRGDAGLAPPFTTFLRDAADIPHRLYAEADTVAASSTPATIPMDIVYILLIVGFFALSAGLVRVCAVLMAGKGRR